MQSYCRERVAWSQMQKKLFSLSLPRYLDQYIQVRYHINQENIRNITINKEVVIWFQSGEIP